MKFLSIIKISLGAAVVSFLYLSCAKSNPLDKVATTDPSFNNKAMVQVFNATVGAARNYVYVDALPVTGAALAYGGTFPATPSNFALTAGNRLFLIKDTLPATTQTPLSFAESFNSSSNYTIFMYDTLNSVKQKTVSNNIVIPFDTTSRLRFADFAYSPNAIPNFDVYSAVLKTNVFTNVGTTDVTGYVTYLSNFNDTLYLRLTGTTTNLLNRTNTTGGTTPIQVIINPIRLRSYTIVFRGGYRTDLTTTASVRTLSAFSNN